MSRTFSALAVAAAVVLVAVGASPRAAGPHAAPAGSQTASAAQTPASAGQAPAPAAQAPTAAQTPALPGGTQPPVFREGINFVRVDVIVSDRNGNSVDSLTADDFEIVEQNAPQKIETFKLISLDGGLVDSIATPPRAIRSDLDEETEAARDDVRLFAIFLDDYHVRRESSMVAREQIARFVQTQLGPSDMVGLMTPLQPTASVRMSRNHEAIARGISQFLGRKYDYTPMNDMEEKYAYYPAETVERIRNQVSMSAIKALILKMGGLKEGRKALVLVSEGYNAMLPPQMRDPVAALPGFGNDNRNNPDAGVGSIVEDRANFSSTADLEFELRDMWDLANKNNVAIYAVDPRGLSTGEFGIDQNIGGRTDRAYLNATMETLRTLAFNTDGRAILNRNDLTLAMKQIVKDQSAYYLLGYNSSFTATDGKFHEIKVRVKRPGVQVRARKGYWAYTAADAARATAPPAPAIDAAYSNALAAVTTPQRSRSVRSWLATSPATDGRTRLTLVWEPVPRLPGDRVRPGDVAARVMVTAIGVDGTPFFRGRTPASSPGGAPAGAPGGAAAVPVPPQRVTFDVPPGKVQLKLAVENADADVIDTETREFDVPDLTAATLILGEPAVFRARTAREFQTLRADTNAVPSVARDFSRAERVFVRVPVFGSVAPEATMTAKLLNRTGTLISELAVTTAPDTASPREIELMLSSLAAGDYLVEISAAGGGATARHVFAFRLSS